MSKKPRHLDRKYVEPNHSQLLNWNRKAGRREIFEYGGGRYLNDLSHVIRNPRMKPLLHRGRKP